MVLEGTPDGSGVADKFNPRSIYPEQVMPETCIDCPLFQRAVIELCKFPPQYPLVNSALPGLWVVLLRTVISHDGVFDVVFAKQKINKKIMLPKIIAHYRGANGRKFVKVP